MSQRNMVFGREPAKAEQAWLAGGAIAAWWLMPVTGWIALSFALAVASNDVAWGVLWVINTAVVEAICAARWTVRVAHAWTQRLV